MESQKLSRALNVIEARTTLAERAAGRQALPVDRDERRRILASRTLALLSAEDRQLVMDESDVIRIEHPTECDRMRRRIQSGEDRVPDPHDQAARLQYFRDWAADALAGMTHDQAVELIQEVAV